MSPRAVITASLAFQVAATISKATVLLDQRVQVSGAVRPGVRGRPVVLQRKVGARWVRAAGATLDRRGRYSFSVPVAELGTSTYRVQKPASDGRRASTSKALKVRALNGIQPRHHEVATGRHFSCATYVVGGPRCVGRNNSGQLGTTLPVTPETLNGQATTTPVVVTGDVGDVRDIASGHHVSCVVRADTKVACWGLGARLGNGMATPDSAAAVVVPGLTGAVSIDASEDNVCVVLVTGGVTCWGTNEYGALGNGTTDPAYTPVPVRGLVDAVTVATGLDHACAVRDDATVVCWGKNVNGQLGVGRSGLDEQSLVPVPVAVAGGGGYADVAVGGNATCGVLLAGTVRCWGFNYLGLMGRGTEDDLFTVPTSVPGLTGIRSIGLSRYNACFAKPGAVSCSGWNMEGQLGAMTPEDEAHTPVAGSFFPSGPTAPAPIQLDLSGWHTCLSSGASVWCGGSDEYGALGRGVPFGAPTEVASFEDTLLSPPS